MTLARLVLAWLPVAVEFAVVAGLSNRLYGFESAASPGWTLTRGNVLWRSVEAAVTTCFASLWFDSLGHGSWWLLFALVGSLVGVQRLSRERLGPELRALAVDVARYVLAGAILAWSLG